MNEKKSRMYQIARATDSTCAHIGAVRYRLHEHICVVKLGTAILADACKQMIFPSKCLSIKTL
jgi:hypothetical protein